MAELKKICASLATIYHFSICLNYCLPQQQNPYPQSLILLSLCLSVPPLHPESIVNEHPVTIYPGRASPTRRMPPRTLPGSMERHREVCRKNLPDNSSSPSSSSVEDAELDEVDNRMHREEDARMIATVTGVMGTKQQQQPHHHGGYLMSSSQLLQQQELLSRSPPAASAITVNRNNHTANGEGEARMAVRHSINTNTRSAKRIASKASSGDNEKRKQSNNCSNGHQGVGGDKQFLAPNEDSEEFSDDSLEDTSLPPPPPPPVVPPPPSLSCPVTPNKRGSIAWEINLDDPLEGRGIAEVEKVNSGGGTGKVRLDWLDWSKIRR